MTKAPESPPRGISRRTWEGEKPQLGKSIVGKSHSWGVQSSTKIGSSFSSSSTWLLILIIVIIDHHFDPHHHHDHHFWPPPVQRTPGRLSPSSTVRTRRPPPRTSTASGGNSSLMRFWKIGRGDGLITCTCFIDQLKALKCSAFSWTCFIDLIKTLTTLYLNCLLTFLKLLKKVPPGLFLLTFLKLLNVKKVPPELFYWPF